MPKHLLSLVFLSISVLGLAQDEDSYVFGDREGDNQTNFLSDKWFSWDRVAIGGGFRLDFGTRTFIEIAPNIGFYFTRNIMAGIRLNYIYYEDKSIAFNTSLYGGGHYVEYLFNNIPVMAHAELELINIEGSFNERINILNTYIGGGFKQSLGQRSFLFVLGLWNLNETEESFYIQPNPILRYGITIGIGP